MKTIFGNMEFDTGFKRQDSIIYFGEAKSITVKAKAYFEKDGITKEQMDAMKKYCDNKAVINNRIIDLAMEYSEDAKNRFIPRTLLFERDGECALLCDDIEEPDDGIAICIFPNEIVISQDDYL